MGKTREFYPTIMNTGAELKFTVHIFSLIVRRAAVSNGNISFDQTCKFSLLQLLRIKFNHNNILLTRRCQSNDSEVDKN